MYRPGTIVKKVEHPMLSISSFYNLLYIFILGVVQFHIPSTGDTYSKMLHTVLYPFFVSLCHEFRIHMRRVPLPVD